MITVLHVRGASSNELLPSPGAYLGKSWHNSAGSMLHHETAPR